MARNGETSLGEAILVVSLIFVGLYLAIYSFSVPLDVYVDFFESIPNPGSLGLYGQIGSLGSLLLGLVGLLRVPYRRMQ